MTAIRIICTILLVICALIVVVSVLLQQGQARGLGAISGGAETFFGKNKAKSMKASWRWQRRFAAVRSWCSRLSSRQSRLLNAAQTAECSQAARIAAACFALPCKEADGFLAAGIRVDFFGRDFKERWVK